MCDSSIDEFSVMTYLSQFPHAEPKQQVAGCSLNVILCCSTPLNPQWRRSSINLADASYFGAEVVGTQFGRGDIWW